jgi:hypothetical protein
MSKYLNQKVEGIVLETLKNQCHYFMEELEKDDGVHNLPIHRHQSTINVVFKLISSKAFDKFLFLGVFMLRSSI